jgi:hypothetical protein
MGGYNLGVDMSIEANQHVDAVSGGYSRITTSIDLIGEQLRERVNIGALQLMSLAPMPGGGSGNSIEVMFVKPGGEAVIVDRITGNSAISSSKDKFAVPVYVEVPLNGYLRASNVEIPVALRVTGTIIVSVNATVDVLEKRALQSLPVDKAGFTAKTAAVTDIKTLGSLRYALDADFNLAGHLVFAPLAPNWLIDPVLKEIPQKESAVKVVENEERRRNDLTEPVIRVQITGNRLRAESRADWALGQRDGKPALKSRWSRTSEITMDTRRAGIHLVSTPRQLAMCGEHAGVKFFLDCPAPTRNIQTLFQGEGIWHEREVLFQSVPTEGEDIVQ